MMIKIKDKYTFGIIAGVLANIPITILDYIFYLIGINKYQMWQIAASVYLNNTNTIAALIIGIFTDFSVVSMMGIVVIYLLYFTGTEYYWLKGLSMGAVGWVFAFGVFLRTQIVRIDPVDAGTNFYHVVEHLLLGVLIAWISVKYGKRILEKQGDLL